MTGQNLYEVLGIPADASRERIRAAYRALAKAHHPDRTGAGEAGRFREVTDAYEVLSDPTRRAAHDRRLGDAAPPPASPRADAATAPRDEPVERHRRHAAGGSQTGRARREPWGRHRVAGATPADLGVLLTPAEAARGVQIPLDLPAHVTCGRCDGGGREWAYLCRACGGAGVLWRRQGIHVHLPGPLADGSLWDVAVPALGAVVRVLVRVAP